MEDDCSTVPEVCDVSHPTRKKQMLATDCFIINSLICTKEVQKVAELRVPAADLGVVIGPGGDITPLIRLEPDFGNIVNKTILIKDKVINIGHVPASVVVAGIELPINLLVPFQHHFECPGACPEDKVIETPLKAEVVIVQGIAALGITAAQVLIKIILRTTITVVRPIIAKIPGIIPLEDVNSRRCEDSTVPSFTPPISNGNGNGGGILP